MQLHSAIFYTDDLDKIIEFYRDFLNFDVDYIQEGKFASFKLGDGRLGIKQKKEDRETPGSQTVFIEVENIEGLYEKYKTKGANFYKDLVDQGWAINFAILDPDGNKLDFLKSAK